MDNVLTRQKTSRTSILFSILGLAIVIVAWWGISLLIGTARLPTPLSVGITFINILFYNPCLVAQGGGNGILVHLMYTVYRCLLGTILGMVVGIIIGIVMAKYEGIYLFLEYPLELIRAIPPLAAIPFFLLWLGNGSISQIAVIAFYACVMMIVTTLVAIHNIQSVYLQFASTLGASKNQIFKLVILPGIIPELIGGIRVALSTAWGMEIVAELMGSYWGVGKVLALLVPFMDTGAVIASIIWVSLIGVVVDRIMVLVLRRWTRWAQ
jgi:ABC-type nitrate/sulfonate/bicarbonate transport system permease component